MAKGADGFRVDMADSLVKNDGDEKIGTMEVWKDVTTDVRKDFPDMALVSEWNNPGCALNCGFDMDFCLDWYGNSYSHLVRYYQIDKDGKPVNENSYFNHESENDPMGFLKDFLPKYEARAEGMYCLITGNHDCKRTSFNLSEEDRKLAFAFLLTMPGAPFLYYGDEISMAYRWTPTKEGGYHRTGSRTPMQWDNGTNLGFSDAAADKLYLPVDPNPNGTTVVSQEADPNSMLHYVRSLIALRQSNADLGNYSPFAIYSAEEGSRLFAYKRGNMLVAMNPSGKALPLTLDGAYEPIFTMGAAEVTGKQLTLGAQSFVVLQPKA